MRACDSNVLKDAVLCGLFNGSRRFMPCVRMGMCLAHWLKGDLSLFTIMCVVQAMANIDKASTGLTVTSAALLLLALFQTAQYRSAILDSTLVEMGLAASLLLVREGLRRFNQNYIVGSGNVYNIRKKPATRADANAASNPGVM